MNKKYKLHLFELLSLIIFIISYSILLSPLLLIDSITIFHIVSITFIMIWTIMIYGSIKTWFKYKNKYLDKSSNLYLKVNKLSDEMGAQKPKLIILKTPTPNAYATDALPTKPIIILTTGLLNTLNESEIEAVLAHEISHINSYDIYYMMFLSTLLSIIRKKHNFTRQSVGSNDIVMFIIFIVPFIITRINLFICRINFFLISRIREYIADKDAAKVTTSKDMKNALLKINNQIYNLNKLNANKFYLNSYI